jgi:hypothetical protein
MWIKEFTDGTTERGSDVDIAAGKASWSKGRLGGIQSVKLLHDLWTVTLVVPETNWHQFDRFQVDLSQLGEQTPKRTHRAIQAEVQQHHVGQQLVCFDIGGCFVWAAIQEIQEAGVNQFMSEPIQSSHVGKWVTIVLSKRKHPHVGFLAKGRINDHKYISR